MTLDVIEGNRADQAKRIAEIRTEIKQITDMMCGLACGDGLVIPISKNGLIKLAEVLGRLMDERVQLEKPSGLNEIKAQVEKLIEIKEHIESGDLIMPDVIKTEIENSIIRLMKERVELEKQLTGTINQ